MECGPCCPVWLGSVRGTVVHGWRGAGGKLGGESVGDRRGVLFDVVDHSDYIVGDAVADGAAGVRAQDDCAGWVEDEPGGLHVARVGVDEGASGRGELFCVGAVPDREAQAEFGDQFGGACFVVHRQRHQGGAGSAQFALRPLEGAELAVAVGTPGAAVEEHYTEPAVERLRQLQGVAVGDVDRDFGETVTGASTAMSNLFPWGIGCDIAESKTGRSNARVSTAVPGPVAGAPGAEATVSAVTFSRPHLVCGNGGKFLPAATHLLFLIANSFPGGSVGFDVDR